MMNIWPKPVMLMMILSWIIQPCFTLELTMIQELKCKVCAYAVVDTSGFYESAFPSHKVRVLDLEPHGVDGDEQRETVHIELFVPPDVMETEEGAFVDTVLPAILQREFPDLQVEAGGILFRTDDPEDLVIDLNGIIIEILLVKNLINCYREL